MRERSSAAYGQLVVFHVIVDRRVGSVLPRALREPRVVFARVGLCEVARDDCVRSWSPCSPFTKRYPFGQSWLVDL